MLGHRCERAIQSWKEVLGSEFVRHSPDQLAPYARGASGLTREIKAVLLPVSTEEVQRVVAVANEYLVPLYPLSRGCNWGLGERLPVRDGAAIVDLGRMDRIHEVSVDQRFAVIEPGVSQGRLYEYLAGKDLPLVFNVTGSSRDSSLIGNALERGVGYMAGRAGDLFALEVVLGNGRVVRTGCGHFEPSQSTGANPEGVGPALDGLFAQSNFGIVTRGTLSLLAKPEYHMVAVCTAPREQDLGLLVEALGGLRKDGIIRTAFHIAHRDRSRISICPLLAQQLVADEGMAPAAARKLAEAWFEQESFGSWSAFGGLMGSRAGVREAAHRILEAMSGIGRVRLIDDARLARLEAAAGALRRIPAMRRKHAMVRAIRPFYELSRGVPTDAALASVCWPVTGEAPGAPGDPNDGPCGLLYCLPMVPLSGEAAVKVVSLANRVIGAYNLTPYITLNMVSARALECVINVAFDRRREEDVSQAHRAMRELQESCLKEGWIPYRTGIDGMVGLIKPDDPFWKTVADLKSVLDPNHIIAPGRYSPV